MSSTDTEDQNSKLTDNNIQVSQSDTDVGSEEKKVVVEDMWQLKMTSLSQQNLFIFENGLWVDCVFVVGATPGGENQKFGLHRLLLSKASPVFDRMLNGDMAEKNEICVTDIEPQTFKHLMTFVYSGALDMSTLSIQDILAVCCAADKYMIDALKMKCSDHLISEIGPSDTYSCLQIALLLNLTELADRARKIVIQRTDEVFAAPTFQKQFNNSSQDLVLELVQQPQLHIDSEAQLITPCLRWAIHQVIQRHWAANSKNYKQALGPILQHLRFYALTPQEFANLDVFLSLVFNSDDKHSILVQIILRNFKRIPSNLSQNFENRTKPVVNVPNFLMLDETNSVKYYCKRCKKSLSGPGHQDCTTCSRCVIPAIVSNSKLSCSLFIKVDVDIRIYGLCLADAVPDLVVQVFRESTIPISIGNNHTYTANNKALEFESWFTVKANTNYTISVSSLSRCCREENVSTLNEITGSNLFTELSFQKAKKDYAIIMGIFYKRF